MMESQKARECDGALVCVTVRGVDGVPTSDCLQVGINKHSGGTTSDRAAFLLLPLTLTSSHYDYHYYIFVPLLVNVIDELILYILYSLLKDLLSLYFESPRVYESFQRAPRCRDIRLINSVFQANFTSLVAAVYYCRG